MNEKIRKTIIGAFADSPTRSEDSMLSEVAKSVGTTTTKVFETLRFMQDKGELMREGQTGYRLTLPAKMSQDSLGARVKKYVIDNWLALAALIISAIAGISAVVSTIISLTALNKCL